MSERDPWAAWLLERRHGADPEELERQLAFLAPVRDRVLDGAALRPADHLLDVGTGDGLIAFGALDRLGPEGRVTFSDVSDALLAVCRDAAGARGELDRCRFLRASAEQLDGVEDASVDAVTMRSVLIYVADVPGALRQARRVLRPGGRLSVFEPINRFGHPEPDDRLAGYDVAPVAELAAAVKEAYDRHLPPADSGLLAFDERDLLAGAEAAGFGRVSLTLEAVVDTRGSAVATSWETLLRQAPNPLAPTLGELLDEALDADGRRRLEQHLRPLVERGAGETRRAVAYLTAEL